ncbi:MAG: DEAD/DEAH box helicase [Ignavibacteriae bacterium HGW-Ignavibacteriae-2]|nr:MAG: DEAD/DEAH box helicase [Ignavibacteriae bacterium HGW-Ignavibacteriae-2]
MSFEKINLIKPIQKALTEEGYTVPTPIQKQAIPIILDRKDLLGCAQTGTGKTAAFALPILQILDDEKNIINKRRNIRSLIVTPTRELAIQIGESFSAYGRHMSLKNVVVFGGVPQKAQTDKLRAGVDILIATPGRLLDLMNQNYISLQHINLFVLDEADRMLDMGFINDVKKIIAKLPSKRQSLFFSATMPSEIVKLAKTILVNPVKIEVTPESPTVEAIKQGVYYVAKPDKKALLLHLLKDPNISSALVFTRTKHGANNVAKDLNKAKILSEAIHGNKSQNARQNALHNFKTKKTRVLVATDIAARGIDIDELSHVINYEIPNIPETYVHRIGRTGRAGLGGVALSLCDTEEKVFLRDINKLISKPIPVIENHPFVLTALDGENSKQLVNKPLPRKSKFNGSSNSKNQKSWRRKNDAKQVWTNDRGI